MIVCEDVDVSKVIEGAMTSMRFTRQGQSCTAASRIFVHESIFDSFLKGLKAKLNELKIGDPMDMETDVGSIVSRSAPKDSHLCGYREKDAWSYGS